MDHGTTQMSIDGPAGPQALDVDHLGALRAGLAALTSDLGQARRRTSDPTPASRACSTGSTPAGSAARLIVPVLAGAAGAARLPEHLPGGRLRHRGPPARAGRGGAARRPLVGPLVAGHRARAWSPSWPARSPAAWPGQLLVNVIAAGALPGRRRGARPGPRCGTPRWPPRPRRSPPRAGPATAAAQPGRQAAAPRPGGDRAAPRALRRRGRGAGAARRGRRGPAGWSPAARSPASAPSRPAFLTLALALLAARAALPVDHPVRRRALRRGRLGVALAGFQLSRRPGAARLFTLLVAAVAVAGYAACAVDVAAQGRAVAVRARQRRRPGGHAWSRSAARSCSPRSARSTRTATSRWRPPSCPAAARSEPPGLALDTSRDWPRWRPGPAGAPPGASWPRPAAPGRRRAGRVRRAGHHRWT